MKASVPADARKSSAPVPPLGPTAAPTSAQKPSPSPSSSSSSSSTVVVEKSLSDARQYRYLQLPNKVRVLLVSDPDTEKSACCCDVRVGSFADPAESQGLAHFLEHMLFMGTEQYPEENGYSAYLNAHGGGSNAYTSQEDTVYYFSVLNAYLPEAMSMFASFFTCPLFAESSTMREVSAVDNEHTKNIQNDSWRMYQLLKTLCRPSHPLAHFSTGNMATLHDTPLSNGVNVRDLLLKFHATHYSANNMCVCVYSNLSLADMEAMATARFSGIPNHNASRFAVPADPFAAPQLQRMVRAVPIQDKKLLDVYFPLPAVESQYLSKPHNYLAHLLGHESAGSVLSRLKALGYANSLSAYASESYCDFALMSVHVELTDSGLLHYEEVLDVLFAYVGMIVSHGPLAWIAQEVKDLSQLNFRFINKSDPDSYVTKLAYAMQVYAAEHIVSGDEVLHQVDLDAVGALLTRLTPENCFVVLRSKTFDDASFETEKWYGVRYSVEAFTSAQRLRWAAAMRDHQTNPLLHLPEPNPFLPKDFSLRSEASAAATSASPSLIYVREERRTEAALDAATGTGWFPQTGRGSLLWHLLDVTWKVPKVTIRLRIESHLAFATPLGQTLADAFVAALWEVLSEYSYYADCAGLQMKIEASKGGLDMKFSGYQDKAALLVHRAVDEVARLGDGTGALVDAFARLKEKQLRGYLNDNLYAQPYHKCIYGTAECLEEPRWSAADKHNAFAPVVLQDVLFFGRSFLRQARTELFVHGNYSAAEARTLYDSVLAKLQAAPLPSAQACVRRTVHLAPGSCHVYRQHASFFNADEANSAIENSYLVGFEAGCSDDASALLLEALLALTVHLLSEPAFDQLRTKEQLGYIASVSRCKVGQQLGARVIVQSNSRDPAYLDTRVEAFLQAYTETLVELSKEEFAANVQAVVEDLLEKPKNLNQESGAFWDEVVSSNYVFDRKKKVAAILRSSVEQADVVAFYKAYLLPGAGRTKFSSQFYGKDTSYAAIPSEDATVLILDPTAFKKSSMLLPVRDHAAALKVHT